VKSEAKESNDRERFSYAAEEITTRLSNRLALSGAALAVVLSPLDLRFRQETPDASWAFLRLRVAILVLVGVYLLAVRLSQGKPARKFWAILLPFLGVCVCVGAAIGIACHDENLWLMTLQFTQLASAVLIVPLVQRIPVVIVCALATYAGFSLTFEGELPVRNVVYCAGLALVTSVFATTIGHELYRQAYESFQSRQGLSQSRAELEEVNASLELRVDVQTKDLRRLALRLDDVLESERRRFAGELHDDLGQELTALRFELETLLYAAKDAQQIEGLERATAAVERSHVSVRRMLESLRPRILDDEGLHTGVVWLAQQFRERTGIVCETDVVLEEEPDAHIGLALFRIAQECITNVARHADASHVSLRLMRDTHNIVLCVEDNGRGLPAVRNTNRHGLVGMQERALAVYGKLTMSTAPGGGTRVEVKIPIHAKSPDSEEIKS
jgi:signal transduction histidine kinase